MTLYIHVYVPISNLKFPNLQFIGLLLATVSILNSCQTNIPETYSYFQRAYQNQAYCFWHAACSRLRTFVCLLFIFIENSFVIHNRTG